MIRSFLFVPGSSERMLAKGAATGADALIVDLEDAVVPEARPEARRIAREFIRDRAGAWVRINAPGTRDADADLEAVVPAGPAGVVLPKSRSAADIVALGQKLDVLEAAHGLRPGSIAIMPLVTETPAALFTLGSYAGSSPRLAALTWGAEDLAAAVGATRNRDAEGHWLPPYELARTLCLLAASAAQVAAVDTVFTDYRDLDGLARYAGEARRDGFSGMLAIHPSQVDVINGAFAPTAEEIDRARRIVELFAGHPGTGAIGMDGRMLDRPHLLQAERVLAIAAEQGHE